MESEALARRSAELADSKGASEIVVCTARNERQAKAISDEVALRLKREHSLLPRQVEGGPAGGWTVLDYLDCVLHVFTPEARDRYRLEQLWADAPRLELGLPGEALDGRAARA